MLILTSNIMRFLWKVNVPPKVKTFYWRLCKGWMTVKAKICKWYSGSNSLCSFCERMGETVWHLFVDCDIAKECWMEIGL